MSRSRQARPTININTIDTLKSLLARIAPDNKDEEWHIYPPLSASIDDYLQLITTARKNSSFVDFTKIVIHPPQEEITTEFERRSKIIEAHNVNLLLTETFNRLKTDGLDISLSREKFLQARLFAETYENADVEEPPAKRPRLDPNK